MKGTNRSQIAAAMAITLGLAASMFARKMAGIFKLSGSKPGNISGAYVRRGTGHTCAQQKRDAKKRRNQLSARSRGCY